MLLAFPQRLIPTSFVIFVAIVLSIGWFFLPRYSPHNVIKLFAKDLYNQGIE